MLSELLNQKVSIEYTTRGKEVSSFIRGVVTAVDDDFIQIDGKNIISKIYIVKIEVL